MCTPEEFNKREHDLAFTKIHNVVELINQNFSDNDFFVNMGIIMFVAYLLFQVNFHILIMLLQIFNPNSTAYMPA